MLICKHNHLPDLKSIEITKANIQMKEKACITEKTPQKIFAEAAEELEEGTKHLIKSEDSAKRLIRSQRQDKFPKQPHRLLDLKIEGDWSKTSCNPKENFLLYDNKSEDESRIIIFSTRSNMESLSNADTWMMDGNFSMAPEKFLTALCYKSPTW